MKGQSTAGISQVSPDGLTPGQQLVAINRRAARLIDNQQVLGAAVAAEGVMSAWRGGCRWDSRVYLCR